MEDNAARRRVRFSGAQRVQLTKATCRVRVRLEVPTGGYVVGMAEGGSSLDEQIRSSAEATIDALRQMVKSKDYVLQLRDVTTFDAFGKSGVMVSLRVEHQKLPYMLTGFSPVGDASTEFPADVQVDVFRRDHVKVANVAQAVALAVLNATNRILSGA
jgi:hypothetical protein